MGSGTTARADKQERAAGEQDRSQASARLRRARREGQTGLARLHGDHHKAEEHGARAGELHLKAKAGRRHALHHESMDAPRSLQHKQTVGQSWEMDVWLISQTKADAKKETEEKLSQGLLRQNGTEGALSRSRTAACCFLMRRMERVQSQRLTLHSYTERMAEPSASTGAEKRCRREGTSPFITTSGHCAWN